MEEEKLVGSAPIQTEQSKPSVTFLDNPHAPEVFASGMTGMFLNDGVVTVTFESARINHITSPGPVNRVVVGRLTMPIAGVQGLALGLYDFLKKRGLDPIPPAPPKEQQQ